MITDLLNLAVSNLLRRRLRSWLTVLGVVIGITAVVALIGLGEGLRSFITAQFSIVGTDAITIQAQTAGFGPPGAGVANPLSRDALERIRDVRGTEKVFGRVVEEATVEFNDRRQLSFIGSAPEGEALDYLYERLNLEVQQGRLLEEGEVGKVVLGSEFTTDERFDKPVRVGNRLSINGKDFDVIGILEEKGSFVTDTTILMAEDDARELLDIDRDEYDVIIARAQEGFDINEVVERIERELRDERDVDIGEEDFTVETSQESLENLESTLFAVQLFVYIIAGVSLLVGGIGISNTMYTAVLERITEIGTIKAIGAQQYQIFSIFSFEAGLIGSVGGLVGATVGAGAAHLLAWAGRKQLGIDLIQAHTGIALIAGAIAFSFIIGLIAGILPAYQASRLHPVEALRAK